MPQDHVHASGQRPLPAPSTVTIIDDMIPKKGGSAGSSVFTDAWQWQIGPAPPHQSLAYPFLTLNHLAIEAA